MFRKALDDYQLTSIDMGETRFVLFGPGTASCVGTQGLAGCTAVMIVSSYAVIISHIPPTSNAGNDMNRIEGLYRHHQQWFPRASSDIVGAADGSVLLIGPKANIIMSRLSQMGIQPRIHLYDPRPSSQEFAGRGTVLVDSRGSAINIYIEDRLVDRIVKPLQ